MERLLRKYRFYIIGILFRILSAFLCKNFQYYYIINYSIPSNFFQLILSMIILICDIFFIIDSILYYIVIKEMICIRVDRQTYYHLILKNILIAFLLLLLPQFFIPIFTYHVLNYIYVIYSIILIITFLISFKIKSNIHENLFIFIQFFIMYCFKFIIFLMKL
jgi:hypothetical protein